MSTVTTWAIRGYPPSVCASAISTIGLPSGGTWIVPGETAVETRSVPLARTSRGPSRRSPMRLDLAVTPKRLE